MASGAAVLVLTAVRVLIDVSCLCVDDGLDKLLEILVLGKQLVEVSKLVACISQPLSTN